MIQIKSQRKKAKKWRTIQNNTAQLGANTCTIEPKLQNAQIETKNANAILDPPNLSSIKTNKIKRAEQIKKSLVLMQHTHPNCKPTAKKAKQGKTAAPEFTGATAHDRPVISVSCAFSARRPTQKSPSSAPVASVPPNT